MEAKKNIPWRMGAITAGAACCLLLAICLGLEVAYAIDFDSTRRAAYVRISGTILAALAGAFQFFKPFVQVAIVLFMLYWVQVKFFPGLNLGRFELRHITIEKLLVVLLVGGFVVLSVTGGLDALVYAKDLAMVALGFYFGSLRKA